MAEQQYFDVIDRKYNEEMFNFKCENTHFEKYLKTQAYYDMSQGYGVTYFFINSIDDKIDKILGFYTLKNTSLTFKEIDEGQRIGIPAIEISQFAVNKECIRKGIGRIMIQNIISFSDSLRRKSAIRDVVLCSVKDSVKFYKKMHFKETDNEEVFIPRENCNKDCVGMYRNIIHKN